MRVESQEPRRSRRRPPRWTLAGVMALGIGLALTPVGAAAAAAAPQVDLRDAPVPGMCGHPAGDLVNGKLHFGTNGDDYLQRSYTGSIRGGADAVAVIGCNAGGVSWPQTLVFYRVAADGTPTMVGSYYLGKIRHSEHVDVRSASITGGRLVTVLHSYEGAGCQIHRISAAFHVADGTVAVSSIHKGPVVHHCPA